MATWATDDTYSGLTGGQAVWNGTNTKVEPSAGQKASGFIPGDPAVAQHLNWLLRDQFEVDVQEFTSNGTFSLPTGAVGHFVLLIGGGGGGGSGAFHSTQSGGGGGAQSGELYQTFIPAGFLEDSATVVVGTGGAGAAAATVSGNGNEGSNGNNTTVTNPTNGFQWLAHRGESGNPGRTDGGEGPGGRHDGGLVTALGTWADAPVIDEKTLTAVSALHHLQSPGGRGGNYDNTITASDGYGPTGWKGAKGPFSGTKGAGGGGAAGWLASNVLAGDGVSTRANQEYATAAGSTPYTFEVPGGVYSIPITLRGAGGGGGENGPAAGGAGGDGGEVTGDLAVTPGDILTIYVPTGGGGGSGGGLTFGFGGSGGGSAAILINGVLTVVAGAGGGGGAGGDVAGAAGGDAGAAGGNGTASTGGGAGSGGTGGAGGSLFGNAGTNAPTGSGGRGGPFTTTPVEGEGYSGGGEGGNTAFVNVAGGGGGGGYSGGGGGGYGGDLGGGSYDGGGGGGGGESWYNASVLSSASVTTWTSGGAAETAGTDGYALLESVVNQAGSKGGRGYGAGGGGGNGGDADVDASSGAGGEGAAGYACIITWVQS